MEANPKGRKKKQCFSLKIIENNRKTYINSRLVKIPKIWGPPRAPKQSRIKLEHDFHIAQLEQQIMVLNEKLLKRYAKPI